MNTATARVQPEYAGSASATVNVTQQVGGSIGTALLSTVSISASLAYVPSDRGAGPHRAPLQRRSPMAAAQVHGYTTAFWWAAALFAIGDRRRRDRAAEACPRADGDEPSSRVAAV